MTNQNDQHHFTWCPTYGIREVWYWKEVYGINNLMPYFRHGWKQIVNKWQDSWQNQINDKTVDKTSATN